MPDAVPYQAYRSKRQSQNFSSPPPDSRPSSVIASPPSPLPQYQDKEKEVLSAYAFSNGRSSPPVIQVLNPEPATQDIPSPKDSIDSHEYNSFLPTSSCSNGASYEPKLVSTTSTVSSSSSAGPSSSPQLKDAKPLSPPAKRASTFRRVPLRNSRPPLLSSPLGPNHPAPHSRNVSISSVNQSLLPLHDSVARSPPQRKADTWNCLTPSPSSIAAPVDRQLPPVPFMESPLNERQTVFSPETLPRASTQLTKSLSGTPSASTSIPSSSGSLPPLNPPGQRTQAPYRPGFQPRGLYRPLTDDFIALRRVKRDGERENGQGPGMKRVERTKMLRRLEKLIDIHFPSQSVDGVAPSRSTGSDKRRSRIGGALSVDNSAVSRRASTFFDFDIGNMKISDAGGLWRGVIGSAEVHNIRAAEQRITPWQDDTDVAKCPLCLVSFHPLTNRKHHCRLCGQIICALPVKRPHRSVPCSLLFVVDPNTRKIEEVGEGVDYGVRRRKVNGVRNAGTGTNVEEDKFLKGIRICRTCRPILLRQQYKQEMSHIPTVAKLYEAFVSLEQEIEESLPHFQELVLSLSHNDQPTKEASATRKRLLEAFAQYDGLAKRIGKLPCPNGTGSSQDRVQVAIMTRASIFLQKNMLPLQSLPTPQNLKNATTSDDTGHRQLDPDSKVALALQPLLEQEALLESFVEEAKAQRKFEDVKTLKTNLREIRTEIEKIVANIDRGMQDHTSMQ